MKLHPQERLLRAYRVGNPTVAIADVIVQLSEVRELVRGDFVLLERWRDDAPPVGGRLELRLDDVVFARGTFAEVAGQPGIRLTQVLQP